MDNTDLQQIFVRYLAGEASPEEVKLLFLEFDREDNEAGLRAAIRRQLEAGPDVSEDVRHTWDPVLQDIYASIKARVDHGREPENAAEVTLRIHHRRWLKYTAAATIALLVTFTFLHFFNRTNTKPLQPIAAVTQPDIAPGGNKAILTLSNGTSISLDSLRKGFVSIQGSTKIIQPENGLLTYDRSGIKSSEVLFNTLTTPRGGQYQVVLPDGTKVWLNDASSIYFPGEFTGKVRQVRITGEVYFEVAENAKMPFEVLVNDIAVQVLGTHFNVMAYKDEPVARVTLLQGAVKVKEGSKTILLKPGQQAQVSGDGGPIHVESVDPQGIIAWKNNQFWFNDDSIQTVMRQLSRWYDVEVIIKGDIPQHFDGNISRNISISQVLEALQATRHLQYEIQDRTIIVSP